MLPTRQGSFRLFRLWGIDVHIHWSWFLVAYYSVSTRVHNYTTPLWAVLEYVMLFLIVLMHEFGHSLATRQVGGTSDQIVLWPLGGVAYVAAPQRPGATLWSIAAGPLVNVALWPVFYGIFYAAMSNDVLAQNRDLAVFLRTIYRINFWLLLFNLLPVYPLDGGQILRSLLWFPLGKARSLLVATVIGFIGGLALLGFALYALSQSQNSVWQVIIALFLLSNCWKSFQAARAMRKLELLPRRPEFKCPVCKVSPPKGNFWLCPQCRQAYDPFATNAICPHCSHPLDLTTCPDCGSARAQRAWDASIRDA